jgi:hypothetical protein
LIYPGPETSLSISTDRKFKSSTLKTGSGLSSNDGRGSNPLPARSDSLDIVDGGPDAADIAPGAVPGKLEMPDLRGLKPDRD